MALDLCDICSCPIASSTSLEAFKAAVIRLLCEQAGLQQAAVQATEGSATIAGQDFTDTTGTVAAGAVKAVFENTGAVNVTVNGATLAPGNQLVFEAFFDPVANVFNRLPAIAWDATGVTATLTITEVR